MKVVVDRRTWWRGHGASDSYLFSRDSKAGEVRMCCVGFLCRVLGYSDASMHAVDGISAIEEPPPTPLPNAWLQPQLGTTRLIETPAFGSLYTLNDNPNIDEAEREAELIRQGAELGIDFEFVN